MPVRVAVVEDHPIIMKAVTDMLSGNPDIEMVGTADHGSKLMDLVREKLPDVVILDLGMSTGVFDPIASVKRVLQEFPKIKFLVLTGNDNRVYMQELIAAGARGYILKSDNLSLSLPKAVLAISNGERYYSAAVLAILNSDRILNILTPRELDVLRHVAQGETNLAIGEALGISEYRARNILSNIYSKFSIQESKETHARVEVINRGKELGLILNE